MSNPLDQPTSNLGAPSDLQPTRRLIEGALRDLGDSMEYEQDPNATQGHPEVIRGAEPSPGMPIVPGYEVLHILGRGGMGIVYKARQLSLNRIVALKMIVTGAQTEADDLARFQLEAEAIGKLIHPNIVQIYDVGRVGDVPYFSMEYCANGSLAHKLRGEPQNPQVAAKLIQHLAWGIHAAHRMKIVHRDLKPGNILLQTVDGGLRPTVGETGNANLRVADLPDDVARTPRSPRDNTPWPTSIPAGAIPKITDFGLAKQLDRNGPATRAGWILGTPQYMAPEQARCDIAALGPATDIYALGTILYEMLTGRPPFKAASDVDTIRQLLDIEPIPPTRFEPNIPRDLETICLKCLEKDPAKRYRTACDLGDDLGRFRKNEPILARPRSIVERTTRWIKRHPSLALFTLLAILIGGLGLLGWASFTTKLHSAYFDLETTKREVEADRRLLQLSAEKAEAALDRADRLLYAIRIGAVDREIERGNCDHALTILNECRWDLRDWEWRYLARHRKSACVKPAPRPYLRLDSEGEIDVRVLLHLDHGATLLTGTREGDFLRWNANTGDFINRMSLVDSQVIDAAISEDGNSLAVATRDRHLHIFDTQSWSKRHDIGPLDRALTAIAWRPGTTQWVGFDRQSFYVWDTVTGKQVASYPLKANTSPEFGCFAISPDGKLIVHADHQAAVLMRSFDDFANPTVFRGHTDHITTLAFHPNGEQFASGSLDKSIKLWKVSSSGVETTLHAHQAPIEQLVFNPTGERLISVGQDRVAYLWDTQIDRDLLSFRCDLTSFDRAAFNPDGNSLVLAERDGPARVYLAVPDIGDPLFTIGSVVSSLAFHPTKMQLAIGSFDGRIRVWHTDRGRELHSWKAHDNSITSLAYVGTEGDELTSVTGNPLRSQDPMPGRLRVWDMRTQMERLAICASETHIARLAVHPQGTHIATASLDGTCCIWDVRQGARVRILKAGGFPIFDVAFHPDGRRIALAGADGNIYLYEWKSGKLLGLLQGHTESVICVSFSPDGKTLVSSSIRLQRGGTHPTIIDNGSVRLWDVQSRQFIQTIDGIEHPVWQARFSPDGRYLLTGGGIPLSSKPMELKLWDAETLEKLADHSSETGGAIFGIAFHNNGKIYAAAGYGEAVQLHYLPPKR